MNVKKISFIVFLFIFFLFSGDVFAADFNQIEVNQSQKVTVDEGGLILEFTPLEDGNYRFANEVEKKRGEDNIFTHFDPL